MTTQTPPFIVNDNLKFPHSDIVHVCGIIRVIHYTTLAAHTKYACFLSCVQPVGVARSRSRRLYNLSASLTSLAWDIQQLGIR